jgi:hypothetical protein
MKSSLTLTHIQIATITTTRSHDHSPAAPDGGIKCHFNPNVQPHHFNTGLGAKYND